jgi:hypothetical protein
MATEITKYELLWALNKELDVATNSYTREMAEIIDDDFFKNAFDEDPRLEKIIVRSYSYDESGSMVTIEVNGIIDGKEVTSGNIPTLSYMDKKLGELNNLVLYKRFGIEEEHVFTRKK